MVSKFRFKLICSANQLTGFYMMGALAVKGLVLEAKLGDDPIGDWKVVCLKFYEIYFQIIKECFLVPKLSVWFSNFDVYSNVLIGKFCSH